MAVALRHRVTIQDLVPNGQDDEGGRPTTPTAIATALPCGVEAVPATGDSVLADRLTTVERLKVRIRRRDDVKPGQLAIVTYRETGSSITLHLESVARSADGQWSTFVGSAVQG